MEQTWFEVGKRVVTDKDAFLSAFAALNWQETDKPIEWGYMQGMGIKSIVKEFHIPNVRRIAWGGGLPDELEGAFLLAVDADFSNGRTRLYFVDDGCGITPVYSEHYPA
jgi:hypothetical protein